MKDTRILCEASEKGKIIVNRCLDLGYDINTYKLEKLLIMIHGIMLSKYQKPFFRQSVVATKYGSIIKEVEKELFSYAFGFKDRMCEYICLLENEEKLINEIVQKYGNLDAFELNEFKQLKLLNDLCYKEGTLNTIPNKLIEKVFDYYTFYEMECVSQKEDSFKKKLMFDYKKNC